MPRGVVTKEQRERQRAAASAFARRPKSAAAKEKLRARRWREGNPNWKGDTVSYSGLHKWIRRNKGRASDFQCVDCGSQAEDWSNTDGRYRRSLDDFVPRCTLCHMRLDLGTHQVVNSEMLLI